MERAVLTDTKLRNLNPRDRPYKVADRDGLYVSVSPAGSVSFRYNYTVNGRQETITFGRYGLGGITLAEARERVVDSRPGAGARRRENRPGDAAGTSRNARARRP